MTAVAASIPGQRLHNQHLSTPAGRRAADVVTWLGAVQAQEYHAAKWALGLRLPEGVVDADIERAFAQGRILRTHVLRPTWHFVTPADIGWMLDLTGPRVQRGLTAYFRNHGLDARLLARAAGVFERALGDHGCLTRVQLAERLARKGIKITGVHLGMATIYAELQQVMCSGPRQGNKSTYALLAARAPTRKRFSRDEALAELTGRFFSSHGPATLRDFAWWSGLTMADGRRGLEVNRGQSTVIDGLSYWTVGEQENALAPRTGTWLLPIYDEYLVAYRDRKAVPHASSTVASKAGPAVIFQHAVVIDGQIAGTWKTLRRGEGVEVRVVPTRKLSRAEREALTTEGERYGRFLEAEVTLSFA
jgi:hypothetical protein